MLSEQQQRIMGYFIEEAKDHLGTIEQGLLNLKTTLEDPEMANEVFRAAHSVKGGAAMLGLTSIQNTAHRLEDYFKVLKECAVQIDQKLETLLLRVYDTLQELVEQLQGPFGLTDDKAEEAMAAVEPVFTELNQHLGQLVNQSGVAAPEDIDLSLVVPARAPAVSITAGISGANEESALRFIFQNDVPARLREMLQLFKQADSAETRQQLQALCQSLAQPGEQLDLPDWCNLLEATEQAILNQDNTYRALAPIVIKDIKRAQEQVLTGRSTEITASEDLLALLPPEVDLVNEPVTDTDLANLLGDDDSDFNLFASDLSAVSETDSEILLDLEGFGSGLDFDGLDFDSADSEALDFSGIDASDNSSDLAPSDLDSESLLFEQAFEDNSATSNLMANRTGPEVGLAELNSLADLFEGEPELNLGWQEEVLDTNSSAELSFEDLGSDELALDEAEDLSGLLGRSTSTQPDANSMSDDMEFHFGELDPEVPSADAASDADLLDLLGSNDVSSGELDFLAAMQEPELGNAPQLGDLDGLFGGDADWESELAPELNSASAELEVPDTGLSESLEIESISELSEAEFDFSFDQSEEQLEQSNDFAAIGFATNPVEDDGFGIDATDLENGLGDDLELGSLELSDLDLDTGLNLDADLDSLGSDTLDSSSQNLDGLGSLDLGSPDADTDSLFEQPADPTGSASEFSDLEDLELADLELADLSQEANSEFNELSDSTPETFTADPLRLDELESEISSLEASDFSAVNETEITEAGSSNNLANNLDIGLDTASPFSADDLELDEQFDQLSESDHELGSELDQFELSSFDSSANQPFDLDNAASSRELTETNGEALDFGLSSAENDLSENDLNFELDSLDSFDSTEITADGSDFELGNFNNQASDQANNQAAFELNENSANSDLSVDNSDDSNTLNIDSPGDSLDDNPFAVNLETPLAELFQTDSITEESELFELPLDSTDASEDESGYLFEPANLDDFELSEEFSEELSEDLSASFVEAPVEVPGLEPELRFELNAAGSTDAEPDASEPAGVEFDNLPSLEEASPDLTSEHLTSGQEIDNPFEVESSPDWFEINATESTELTDESTELPFISELNSERDTELSFAELSSNDLAIDDLALTTSADELVSQDEFDLSAGFDASSESTDFESIDFDLGAATDSISDSSALSELGFSADPELSVDSLDGSLDSLNDSLSSGLSLEESPDLNWSSTEPEAELAELDFSGLDSADLDSADVDLAFGSDGSALDFDAEATTPSSETEPDSITELSQNSFDLGDLDFDAAESLEQSEDAIALNSADFSTEDLLPEVSPAESLNELSFDDFEATDFSATDSFAADSSELPTVDQPELEADLGAEFGLLEGSEGSSDQDLSDLNLFADSLSVDDSSTNSLLAEISPIDNLFGESNDFDILASGLEPELEPELELGFGEAVASSPTESELAEFDDLDAMLSEEDSTDAVIQNEVHREEPADDFSDLEALIGDEPEALVEPTIEPAIEPVIEPTVMPAELTTAIGDAGTEDEFGDLEALLQDITDQALGSGVSAARKSPNASRRPSRRGGISEQTMRVTVKHLDNLNNLVGEMVVNRNTLEQAEERLRQFLDNLLYQVQQLSDVGQRMRDLYERSLLESSLLSGRRSTFTSSVSGFSGSNRSNHATGASFDALEMDRFTGFHTLSQEMIELIVRVRESASDIDFVVEETDQVTRNFRQITTQLQEGLTRSRMVPFAQTADRLPRGVRDNSLKYGKQAELIIEGRDTLIDKMIVELLYDPMTHLVNNAVAHGIETPEERIAAGKAPGGRITIRAFHQGNQTVISVSDDGAGINPEAVRAKALAKKLITPIQAREMSRLDTYDLLFHHGFSTVDQVDDLRGRGVGLDVVRNNLNEIRGTISIDSTIGKGTTFTIRLPLTLSISKALCCISNRARIAFPMDGVEDMLDVPKERVQTDAEGRSCIQWRDQSLPFQSLSDLLRYNRVLGRGSVYGGNQEEDMISIVVLRSGSNFLALQVDQVLGEQEIVIKQLEGPVPKPLGVAGATVLGDGRIMPIADVLELIDLWEGRIRRESGTTSLWDMGEAQQPPEQDTKTEPTVLIVDDSITVRELLSMTFNKVGYRVEQARDGQEAWEKLRSGLPCDLVFCDIEMPRMDGLELLSRIQKDPSLSHLPIAMLTSRGADRHRQMAVQLGAKGYFTKPYLEEVLLDAAQRMLKGEVMVNSTNTQ
jgi:chemotaxis protein histidine kinase CheA/CheY-like chemotaxis protein